MELFILSRKKDVDPNVREASAKTAARFDPNVKDQKNKHRKDIFAFCESILIAMLSGKLGPFVAVARDGKNTVAKGLHRCRIYCWTPFLDQWVVLRRDGRMEKCLRDSGFDKRNVHNVVLIVEKLFQEFSFGKEPNRSINSTRGCFLGAAVHVAILDVSLRWC